MNSTIPTDDECFHIEDDSVHSHNIVIRIISIVVILVVSLLGAGFSVLSIRIKSLHVNPIIVNTGKFFGSGVVLATGFIHILPVAMGLLTDPCLPESWNVYGAYAGLFAMLAALIMQFIEFVAHQRQESMRKRKFHPIINNNIEGSTNNLAVVETANRSMTSAHHSHGVFLQNDREDNNISTYLLEFGIALHSILIGLTLGTTRESFVPLFIAISFHQFFEAIALGAQIARLERTSLRSAILMVILFAITTPIGIGIGVGIHSKTYNPKGVATLLVNGILDSISGGILIYVALVNLIAAEMGVTAHDFHSLSKKLKFLYFVALYSGVAVMALIGRWA